MQINYLRPSKIKKDPRSLWRLNIQFWNLTHNNSSFSENRISIDIITILLHLRFKQVGNGIFNIGLCYFILSPYFHPILYITMNIFQERFCEWGARKRFVDRSNLLLGQCLNRLHSLKYVRYVLNSFFCSIFRSCFCHIISIYISFIKHSNITTNIFKNIEDITLVVYIGKNFTMKMILNHYDSSFGVCDITISWNMCMHINPVLRLATKEPHCSLTKFSRM